MGEGHTVGDKYLDEITFQFGQYNNSGKCVVLQSRLSYVLVNKKPVLPGHLLVIPQRIAHRFTDLNPDEVQDLFMTVQVHILPRKSGDFAENDDIYDKLQNHDREGITDDIKWRSNAEMFEECS